MARSLLTTVIEGALAPSTAPLWVVLHGRHGDLEAARALAKAHLAPQALRVCVRSARTQTRGSVAPAKGNFWFIGPPERPELMTLFDGLRQLDLLLDQLIAEFGADRPLHILAQGESATMAILLALWQPQRLAHLHLIDAQCPEDLARIPLEWSQGPWPAVQITDGDPARHAATRLRLRAFGIEIASLSEAL